jgi:hypothetical protein
VRVIPETDQFASSNQELLPVTPRSRRTEFHVFGKVLPLFFSNRLDLKVQLGAVAEALYLRKYG